jgi:glycosyltransferase involved in cell wall biosynthesis
MTKMLVLHALPDLRRAAGGIATTIPALCSALRDEGIESHIIALAQDDIPHTQVSSTVLAERSPWSLKRRIQSEVLYWRDKAERQGSAFACHSHGLWSFLNHSLVTAALAGHVPLVISLHGMLLPWARQHKAYRKAAAWKLYQAHDLARGGISHVTSEAERREAESAGAPGPFAVVPFGIDVPALSSLTSQNWIRMPCSRATPRTLLFLGRIHPIKNIDSLIKAFALANISGWHLRIVGPDEVGYQEYLRTLARTEGVGDSVSIEGPVFGPEKSHLLTQSDLLVLPSHSENFGAVVAEALAHGTPVIASTGTPWSVLESEGCGWWSEPAPDSLADAIRTASSLQPETLRAMGARGRVYVQSQLTWQTCARKMSAVYRSQLLAVAT